VNILQKYSKVQKTSLKYICVIHLRIDTYTAGYTVTQMAHVADLDGSDLVNIFVYLMNLLWKALHFLLLFTLQAQMNTDGLDMILVFWNLYLSYLPPNLKEEKSLLRNSSISTSTLFTDHFRFQKLSNWYAILPEKSKLTLVSVIM